MVPCKQVLKQCGLRACTHLDALLSEAPARARQSCSEADSDQQISATLLCDYCFVAQWAVPVPQSLSHSIILYS